MTSRVGKPDTRADVELRECLSHDALKSFVMVAGAGSGKTTSLVKALAHLEKQRGAALRRRGQRIACITYTEVAVREIWGDVGNDPLFHVSTIHSFLWTLVRPFQSDIRAWAKRRLEEKLADLKDKELKFGPRTHAKTKIKNAEDQEKYREHLSVVDRVAHFNYGTGSDFSSGILGHDDILKLGADLINRHSLMRTLVAQRYPYVFVDESQDTSPAVIEAFKAIARQMEHRFCLGFFGDPMQKIYTTGAGEIEPEPQWATITKPENFRCPESVLAVINRVRKGGDRLEQVQGRTALATEGEVPSAGTAVIFVCSSAADRAQSLLHARKWMAERNDDPHWLSDQSEADVRILVIVHRMAARRLDFEQLYDAFTDVAPISFEEGFREGTLWAVQPFLRVVVPLVHAVETGNAFQVITLLRDHCPLLQRENGHTDAMPSLLRDLRHHVTRLAELMSASSDASVADVLAYVLEAKLLTLDDRFTPFLLQSMDESGGSTDVGDAQTAMTRFLACPAGQLRGYRAYIETESPFSTQQGIKGAEFERVLAVLDDEEGRHNQFSYGKYLGLAPLSETDETNQRDGKETVVDRTRRLFYVCCSRATKDLAVVLFAPDVAAATMAVRQAGHFEEASIITLSG